MKNCLEYWRKRAKLAEAVIAENQIGAWKKWDEIRKTEPPTDEEDLLLFGNWLLKQPEMRLYIKSGLDESYMRMPMKDIVKIYENDMLCKTIK